MICYINPGVQPTKTCIVYGLLWLMVKNEYRGNVSPSHYWKPVEAIFANLHLNYSIFMTSNKTDHCKDAELFVFVTTRPSSFDRRQTIRTTWGSSENIGKKTMLKFVIGQPKRQDAMLALFEEQKAFNDLILYDHPDEYRQLHIKTHAVFKWQQSVCPNVKFIFKADDDTAVDLPRLRYWIMNEMSVVQKNNPAVIFGCIRWKNFNIFRDPDNKYYVSYEDFPDIVFPPFAPGWLTLYSNEAIKAMLQHTHEVNAIPLEDVLYSGILGEKAGVRKIDISNHFNNHYLTNTTDTQTQKCDANKVPYVTATCCYDSLPDMIKAHENLTNIQCLENRIVTFRMKHPEQTGSGTLEVKKYSSRINTA
ncbi:galactosyltransferase domain-containing protein [Ditylenchus destructor]|nr:galactosyltransferase domain-containing protein [Ditylenchus destructor]